MIDVLLIEDNEQMARLVGIWLSEKRGFDIFAAQSMQQAFEILGQRQFDCAIVDLGLPNGHGLATISRLRAAAPSLPLIVFTGAQRSRELNQSIEQHGNVLIYKSAEVVPLLPYVVGDLVKGRELARLRTAQPRRTRIRWGLITALAIKIARLFVK